ncbi:MAG: DUF2007 domain-containing protein [Burkholderiales bacterium]
MKRVYSSFDRIAVHHARNLLAAEGIEAEVRNELLSSAMGELPPAECQAELWVLDDADVPRAEQLLREGPKRHGPPWRCAACGEVSEPQFTQCWKCGVYRSG